MKKFVKASNSNISFNDGTSEYWDLSDIREFGAMLNSKLGLEVETAFYSLIDQIADVSYDAETSLLNLEYPIEQSVSTIDEILSDGNMLKKDIDFELTQIKTDLTGVLSEIKEEASSFTDAQQWYGGVSTIWSNY